MATPPVAQRRFHVAAVVTVVTVVVVRVVGLDSTPGEWYGDISTLYEYSEALGHGDVPPGLYVLGVGPLYPQLLRPFLWILGETYLTIKLASVAFSLLGLLLLYRFARRLVDRETALAATAIGGTMSWWLVYSRLGDLQALVPPLTIATLSATVLAIRTRDEWTTSALAGGLATLGIYLYGNTFVLPIIVALAFLVAWRLHRIGWRDLAAAAGASLVVAVPMLRELIVDSRAVLHGHVGQRMVDGADLLPTLVRGYREALWAYVRVGDGSFRGNAPFAAHVDHLTAVLAVVGIVWWLRGGRRLQGIFLLGSFLLLHLPSVLAGVQEVPSVSRTTAAAPLVALFAAAGLTWVATVVHRTVRVSTATVTVVVVVLIGAVNVHHYFGDYVPGLPYGNTSISREMTDFADTFGGEMTVLVVGVGWRDQMPAVKSVRYPAAHPERIAEEDPNGLDCGRLAELPRPVVLLWNFEDELPAPGLAACADLLGVPRLHHADNGRPVFRSAQLGEVAT